MKKILFLLLLILSTIANAQRLGGCRLGPDTDASGYITRVTAGGVTVSNVQYNAVTSWYLWMKGSSLYTSFTDGGFLFWANATSNAETIKGVVDITWNGSITHASTGIISDGSTGYGNTGVNASTSFTLNNSHFAIYNRTNSAITNAVIFGASTSNTVRALMFLKTGTTYITDHNSTTSGTGRVSVSNSDASGFFISTRVSSTDLRAIRNGSQIGVTATTTNNGTFPNQNEYLLALNSSGSAANFDTREITFWGYGLGFTTSQSAIYSDATNHVMKVFGVNVY